MTYRGAACFIVLVAITVPMASVPSAERHAGAGRHGHSPELPQLRDLRAQANRLLAEGSYHRAAELYRRGLESCRSDQCKLPAIRFLINLGSANYYLHHYGEALRAYTDARSLAEVEQDKEMLGALSVNLSSLYLQLGAVDLAVEAARRGLKDLRNSDSPHGIKLLIHAGQLQVMKGDPAAGEAYLEQAAAAAHEKQDTKIEAQALTELGNTLLAAAAPQRALAPLERAVELRLQNEDSDIHFSWEALGRAHGDLGDYATSRQILTRAIDSASENAGPMEISSCYYARGESNMADGRIAEAYSDLSEALAWARRWKGEVLPADAFRLSSSVELHQIYSAFLDAAMRMRQLTGKQQYAEEAFAASEEIRAQSLRALRNQGDAWMHKLPAEYWDTLAELHVAEMSLLHRASAAASDTAAQLRARLSELEARAGLESPTPAEQWIGTGLVPRLRAAVGASEAYLGFHLGAKRSYLYAISRGTFHFHPLPPREQLSEDARRFSTAVATGSAEAPAMGDLLFRQLFGGLGAAILSKPHWILGLDGALFDVPFAALVEGRTERGPVYSVERRAIQAAPSAVSIFLTPPVERAGGPFIGFGDPIYNSADSRWTKDPSSPRFAGLSEAVFRRPKAPTQQLARLPGSGREVRHCARLWNRGSAAIILTGAEATKANLVAALRSHPSVLHIAAHVVVPDQSRGPAMIATSLRDSGEVDYLSATEVASLRSRLGLVILNGCASGSGAVLPGEGLMGLTRAWLAAGARTVIATRWPVSDGSGDLFESVYRSLQSNRRRGSVALALQSAQLQQLRAGGPRAEPSRWAAYFCFGRN